MLEAITEFFGYIEEFFNYCGDFGRNIITIFFNLFSWLGNGLSSLILGCFIAAIVLKIYEKYIH